MSIFSRSGYPNRKEETPEKESGAVFVFNYDQALKTQFNPQRYFCQSILKSISPSERTCSSRVCAAFYELRVSPVDSSNWGNLDSFTRSGNHFLAPGASKGERDFITGDNTSELGFKPYIVAVWTDVASSFPHIHRWLVQNRISGYVGYMTLEVLRTIEEFHTMCREVDLGFDACVRDGKYLYPKGSDHPLKPEVMSAMGFSPAES